MLDDSNRRSEGNSNPRQTNEGSTTPQRRRSPAGRPVGRGAQRRVIPPGAPFFKKNPNDVRRLKSSIGGKFEPTTDKRGFDDAAAAAIARRATRRARRAAPSNPAGRTIFQRTSHHVCSCFLGDTGAGEPSDQLRTGTNRTVASSALPSCPRMGERSLSAAQ